MISIAQKLWNLELRVAVRPLFGRIHHMGFLRACTNLHSWLVYRETRDMQFEPVSFADGAREIPALSCSKGEFRTDTAMLYLHGGAYVLGGAQSHRALVARLAGACGIEAFLPDYRLAPENPYPAGLEDAMVVYQSIVDSGKNIVLAGDSAGGGLAFALLQRIQKADLPKPTCIIGLSPWTDMTLASASLSSNGRHDPFLTEQVLRNGRKAYIGNRDPRHPEASPLFGKYHKPPPTTLLGGDQEILRDDSLKLAEQLEECGGDVTVHIEKGVPHVWPLYQGLTREADQAIDKMAEFVRKHLPKNMTFEDRT